MRPVKQIAQLATLAAMGMTQTEIAQQTGLAKSTVSRGLSDQRCRDILDTVIRVYIAHAKSIGKRFLQLCYHEDPKISLDAIKHYQQVVGIAPTHTQSVVVNNIFNQVTIGALTPAAVDYVRFLKSGAANNPHEVPQNDALETIDV